MKRELEAAIAAACQKLFGAHVSVELAWPQEQFGDWATNVALQLAGQLSKNPREVAEALAAKLRESLAEQVSEVSIAGPGFINFRFQPVYLKDQLQKAIETAPRNIYGATELGVDKTVLCEFPSPNMAKPYSVGHLRSGLQGWSVHKLMLLHGYRVITDNHLGDYGTPFGKWVVGFLHYSSDEKLAEDGIYELGRVYLKITEELKAEKETGGHELADEVQAWLKKFGDDDSEAVNYAERFKQISLDHMHTIMNRLGIKTEFELGEAFFVKRGQELVDELLKKGIAEISEGAVIVRLDEYGIKTPTMLRKANGAALYATSDLATIEYRQNTWHPEKVFIHTGQEQVLYFQQLKALARKVGFEDTIVHLWHGIIDQKNPDGSRSKMSSRSGVILLEDLLNMAETKARELNAKGSDADVKAVALAAIKFADFAADRKSGILFDWNTIFSLNGFSGPAIQYAAVRIGSILKKAGMVTSQPKDGYDYSAEHQLLLQLLGFPELLMQLQENYELHKLATYLYELARRFNRYYEDTPILQADEAARLARLWLLAQILQVFTTGLDVLGISIPEKM